MNTTKTLTQSQTIVVMEPPAVEAELLRMALEAQQAFYTGNDAGYICHEIQADLSQHFGLDAAQGEYRYYLWRKNGSDATTGLPFAAIYAVNAYGIVEQEKCLYSDHAIASLMRTCSLLISSSGGTSSFGVPPCCGSDRKSSGRRRTGG